MSSPADGARRRAVAAMLWGFALLQILLAGRQIADARLVANWGRGREMPVAEWVSGGVEPRQLAELVDKAAEHRSPGSRVLIATSLPSAADQGQLLLWAVYLRPDVDWGLAAESPGAARPGQLLVAWEVRLEDPAYEPIARLEAGTVYRRRP